MKYQMESDEINMKTLQEREATLKELSDFIALSRRTLDRTLQEVGWTQQELQKEESLDQCSINPQHRVVKSSLLSHTERCEWARDGYTRKEQEESKAAELNSFFNKGRQPITLDAECLSELRARYRGSIDAVPRTMDRLSCDQSREQRLAMYETALEKCQARREQEEGELDGLADLPVEGQTKDEDDTKKAKSHAEVLAEMRDYRRRRQSYRAKNVHITKKSKTDVMREIIEAHMKFLEASNEQDNSVEVDERKPITQERSPSRSRDERSASKGSREPHRHRRSRSRDSSRRTEDRSPSHSRGKDDRSAHRRHHHKHSKHKHKHKHKSKDKDADDSQ